ncbi:MAG: hypothetical protein A2139_07995 [Desulfobacca sp. RBG_16_60_12]|nr:MAG: hypothetical protein A2139_07995 [Desulfobacca sp. RBG_16_60_12]
MSVPVEHQEVTIRSVDKAIASWFDKTVNARTLTANNELRKVPVIFSQGERWAIGRTKQALRDDNGVLILPVIALRRTNIDPDPTGLALGVQTDSITIARRVDPKTNVIQNLEGLKPKSLARKYPAIFDVYTIPFPDRMMANYQLVIQTQQTTQMNEILQKMWRMLDIQKSFVAPFQNDGRQPPRIDQYGGQDPYAAPKHLSSPYVVGFLEGTRSDAGNFEEFTDTERIIKYTTEVRVPFALTSTPEGAPAGVKVQRTAFKTTFGDEAFHFVNDPDIADAIFGKLK